MSDGLEFYRPIDRFSQRNLQRLTDELTESATVLFGEGVIEPCEIGSAVIIGRLPMPDTSVDTLNHVQSQFVRNRFNHPVEAQLRAFGHLDKIIGHTVVESAKLVPNLLERFNQWTILRMARHDARATAPVATRPATIPLVKLNIEDDPRDSMWEIIEAIGRNVPKRASGLVVLEPVAARWYTEDSDYPRAA